MKLQNYSANLVNNPKKEEHSNNFDKLNIFNRLNKTCKISFKGSSETVVSIIENADCQVINKLTDFFYTPAYGRIPEVIPVDFAGNKMIAICNGIVHNIFRVLRMPMPGGIFTRDFKYTKDPLLNHSSGFCISSQDNVFMNNNLLYPSRSVFFDFNMNLYDHLEKVKNAKRDGFLSTDHILGTFVHEWLHSANFFHLFQKYGYNAPNVISKIQGMKFSTEPAVFKIIDPNNKDIHKRFLTPIGKMIDKEVGEYGTTNPLETLTEKWTLDIVESLNKKTLHPDYNPFINQKNKTIEQVVIDTWEGYLANLPNNTI